jgi:mannosyltransferase
VSEVTGPYWRAGRRFACRLPCRTGVVLGAIVVFAAVLRFATLDGQGYWYDEALTVRLLEGDFTEMLLGVAEYESNPPLYYVVAWLWTHVFGTGEVGLRSLSAVAGTTTVVLAYAAAFELSRSSRTALLAASLVAINPLLIWYSQEARAYALLALISGFGFWCFVRALDKPHGRTLAAWGVASALALVTHYFSAFLISVEGVWLIARLRKYRREVTLHPAEVALAVVPIVISAVLVASLAYTQTQQTRREMDPGPLVGTEWIAEMDLGARVGQLGETFVLGFTSPDEHLWRVAAVAVAVAAALLVLGGTSWERRRASLAALVGGTSVALPLLVALAGADYLLARNVLGALFPLTIAVAIGFGASRPRGVGIAGAVVVCALGAASFAASVTDDKLQRLGWRAAADLLGPPRHPRIIASTGGFRSEALRPYMASLTEVARGEVARIKEIDYLAIRTSSGRSTCWWGAVCKTPPKPAVHPRAVRRFKLVDRRVLGRFEVERFVSDSRVSVQTDELFVDRQRGDRPTLFFQPPVNSSAPRARP